MLVLSPAAHAGFLASVSALLSITASRWAVFLGHSVSANLFVLRFFLFV